MNSVSNEDEIGRQVRESHAGFGVFSLFTGAGFLDLGFEDAGDLFLTQRRRGAEVC